MRTTVFFISSELVKFVALERKYIHLEGTGTIKVRIIKHALNEDLFLFF